MRIYQKRTGEILEAVIELIEKQDWKIIKDSNQFEFKWEKEKEYIIYKLRLSLSKNILGLISMEDVPKELRIHIRLIEISKNNIGKNKEYDHIAGCLLAHICNLSLNKDNYEGFVSLEPKTEIINLYKEKYGFRKFGLYLFSSLENSEHLVKKYLSNE